MNDPWWAMGQRVAGFTHRRVNEAATRARAGLLNVISGLTIVLLVFAPETDPVLVVGPFVIWDMFTAAGFGLTPLSPTGVLGTLATMNVRPTWKPTAPKRFAWLLGGSLGVTCLTMRLAGAPVSWMLGVVVTCFALTWLEATLGFCVGCWLYARLFNCEDCEAPYVPE